MPLVPILLMAALLAQQPASSPATPPTLDFEVFRAKVQPIFLARRGEHARCISCHGAGQSPRLQPLSPGATTWNEEQSRKNFEEVKRLVAPGDPLASRLLTKPLAVAAGGDPFHIGSKHWTSQNDPEWQVLAAWVRTGSVAPGAAPAASAAAASFDFDFYRTRVEPIFLKPRQPDEGSGSACVVCHAAVATRMRLQALSPGATSWTAEQSRQNFAAVSRLVTAGEPLKSPLLLHPLDPTSGGSPTLHGGGKVWMSQNNPEWQTLAAWVRTGTPAAGASTSSSAAAVSLDFDFFKTNVQPIFLARRGEHARCVSCHRGGQSPHLQPLSPGAATWDEEQSRKNFEELKRLVAPGDPLASRLLTKPLAVAAGGDPFHIGSKHWTSQNDPEWQTLSAWVRGQTAGSAK